MWPTDLSHLDHSAYPLKMKVEREIGNIAAPWPASSMLDMLCLRKSLRFGLSTVRSIYVCTYGHTHLELCSSLSLLVSTCPHGSWPWAQSLSCCSNSYNIANVLDHQPRRRPRLTHWKVRQTKSVNKHIMAALRPKTCFVCARIYIYMASQREEWRERKTWKKPPLLLQIFSLSSNVGCCSIGSGRRPPPSSPLPWYIYVSNTCLESMLLWVEHSWSPCSYN